MRADCPREGCGASIVVQVGTADPNELRCTHHFMWGEWVEHLECNNCGLSIDGRLVRMLQVMGKKEFTRKHEVLVAQMTALKSENTELLAENARFRRRLEK